MIVKVIVAAANASGSPDFFVCRVECYQHQYDNGEHYYKAKEAAFEADYDGPMVAFDENDGPVFLFEHFSLVNMPLLEIREQIG